MTLREIIKVLETEKECVLRQGNPKKCNRKCADCDLVLPDKDIINAYNYCILVLKKRINTLKEIEEFKKKFLEMKEEANKDEL